MEFPILERTLTLLRTSYSGSYYFCLNVLPVFRMSCFPFQIQPRSRIPREMGLGNYSWEGARMNQERGLPFRAFGFGVQSAVGGLQILGLWAIKGLMSTSWNRPARDPTSNPKIPSPNLYIFPTPETKRQHLNPKPSNPQRYSLSPATSTRNPH